MQSTLTLTEVQEKQHGKNIVSQRSPRRRALVVVSQMFGWLGHGEPSQTGTLAQFTALDHVELVSIATGRITGLSAFAFVTFQRKSPPFSLFDLSSCFFTGFDFSIWQGFLFCGISLKRIKAAWHYRAVVSNGFYCLLLEGDICVTSFVSLWRHSWTWILAAPFCSFLLTVKEPTLSTFSHFLKVFL